MKQLIDCRYIAIDHFKIERGYQPENALFYITDGEIEFSMQGLKEHAGENTLLSFPDHLYFERKMLLPTEFFCISYENSGTQPLPAGKIKIENSSRLLSTLKFLLELSSEFGQQSLKDAFLADIFHQIEAETLLSSRKNDPIVWIVHDFFVKNLHRKISLAEAAKIACISGTGLIYHFKKSTGMTPIEYLTALRIQQAEALLCHSNDPIAHIAALCGFENPYYFSNTFKKSKGVSPTTYRQKYGI